MKWGRARVAGCVWVWRDWINVMSQCPTLEIPRAEGLAKKRCSGTLTLIVGIRILIVFEFLWLDVCVAELLLLTLIPWFSLGLFWHGSHYINAAGPTTIVMMWSVCFAFRHIRNVSTSFHAVCASFITAANHPSNKQPINSSWVICATKASPDNEPHNTHAISAISNPRSVSPNCLSLSLLVSSSCVLCVVFRWMLVHKLVSFEFDGFRYSNLLYLSFFQDNVSFLFCIDSCIYLVISN